MSPGVLRKYGRRMWDFRWRNSPCYQYILYLPQTNVFGMWLRTRVTLGHVANGKRNGCSDLSCEKIVVGALSSFSLKSIQQKMYGKFLLCVHTF